MIFQLPHIPAQYSSHTLMDVLEFTHTHMVAVEFTHTHMAAPKTTTHAHMVAPKTTAYMSTTTINHNLLTSAASKPRFTHPQ